jgi:hypothetical protein
MTLYDFLILACLVEILYIKKYKIFFIGSPIDCYNHLFNLKYKEYWGDFNGGLISLKNKTKCDTFELLSKNSKYGC